MKIRSVRTELLHANGRTDMTKLIVTFRNFVNAPNKILGNVCFIRQRQTDNCTAHKSMLLKFGEMTYDTACWVVYALY